MPILHSPRKLYRNRPGQCVSGNPFQSPNPASVLLQLGPWPKRRPWRLFIIVVNSQHGRHGKALLRLNSSSLHLQTELPPDQQGLVQSWQGRWRRILPLPILLTLHSTQSELSHPTLKTERQGICSSPAYLFLCQATTHVAAFTRAYGVCTHWIISRIRTRN